MTTTAAARLGELGVTMEEAHAFVMGNLGQLGTILQIAQTYGITNSMLGEIAGWPGAAFSGEVVVQFFAANGFNSASLDPSGPAAVGSVHSDSATEGQSISFEVTMTAMTTQSMTMDFVLSGGTATAADYGTITATNGVTIQGSAITIPAGVTTFDVLVPTIDDALVEGSETFNLYVGPKTAQGTIIDNDTSSGSTGVVSIVGDPTTTEGTDLVYLVMLTNATTTETLVSFSLAAGTAQQADFGAPVFSDGVIFNGVRQLTIPAGVSSFTVKVPTVNDTAHEAFETVLVTVDGITGTGYIADNDPSAMVQLVGVSG